jgi:hypothetical protein
MLNTWCITWLATISTFEDLGSWIGVDFPLSNHKVIGTNYSTLFPCEHPRLVALPMEEILLVMVHLLFILHQNHPWGLVFSKFRTKDASQIWSNDLGYISINLGLNPPWHMLHGHFIFHTLYLWAYIWKLSIP